MSAVLQRIEGGSQAHDGSATGDLVIGLVNNMPDAAIRATERQFLALLDAASKEAGADEFAVTLRLFSLPSVPRGQTVRDQFMRGYGSLEDLYDGRIDGLIVTGAEPRTPELEEEPYWQELIGLVDWADANTISTIWSCLASHAAVLHLDGIRRRPLGAKLSGVFECTRATEHQLVADAPASWPVPHSRFNDLPADALLAHDYKPLTHSPIAGIDTFIKQGNSLFLFFQGHLEYETHSLLREYLRDITRFLDGEGESYPSMPRGDFDDDGVAAFDAVRDEALARRNARPLAAVAANAAERGLVHAWRSPAVNIYRNWLTHIAAEKRQRAVGVRRSATTAEAMAVPAAPP